jgi:DNA-binding CsgD family transcriptional regulator
MNQVIDILISTYGLTYREAEVVETISTGRTNVQAGKVLFVTEKTIKFHLTNTYRKLGIKNRATMIVLVHDLKHGKRPTVPTMEKSVQCPASKPLDSALPIGRSA